MLTFSSVRLLLVIVVGLRGSQKNDETQDGPKAVLKKTARPRAAPRHIAISAPGKILTVTIKSDPVFGRRIAIVRK